MPVNDGRHTTATAKSGVALSDERAQLRIQLNRFSHDVPLRGRPSGRVFALLTVAVRRFEAVLVYGAARVAAGREYNAPRDLSADYADLRRLIHIEIGGNRRNLRIDPYRSRDLLKTQPVAGIYNGGSHAP